MLENYKLEHPSLGWMGQARPEQLPPNWNEDWTTWLLLGGRGSGKTRAGAEWVRAAVKGSLPFAPVPLGRIALVAETYANAREVMVEGESGLLAVHDADEKPTWISSRRRLEWPNGAVAQWFSSEDPDGLRGPQFDGSWCDEAAKWRNPQETWDMLQFGLRLGNRPRQCVTTTPRPTPFLKKLIADGSTRKVIMKTQDNADNLAPGFLNNIVGKYQGTRLGRQELDGELIEDRLNALWQRSLIERHRKTAKPAMARIVVAVDPPVTGNVTSDACGIVVAGIGEDQRGYVLADRSMRAVSPEAWARKSYERKRFLAVKAVRQNLPSLNTVTTPTSPLDCAKEKLAGFSEYGRMVRLFKKQTYLSVFIAARKHRCPMR